MGTGTEPWIWWIGIHAYICIYIYYIYRNTAKSVLFSLLFSLALLNVATVLPFSLSFNKCHQREDGGAPDSKISVPGRQKGTNEGREARRHDPKYEDEEKAPEPNYGVDLNLAKPRHSHRYQSKNDSDHGHGEGVACNALVAPILKWKWTRREFDDRDYRA